MITHYSFFNLECVYTVHPMRHEQAKQSWVLDEIASGLAPRPNPLDLKVSKEWFPIELFPDKPADPEIMEVAGKFKTVTLNGAIVAYLWWAH